MKNTFVVNTFLAGVSTFICATSQAAKNHSPLHKAIKVKPVSSLLPIGYSINKDSVQNDFNALYRFLAQNIRFPQSARYNHLIGNVVLGFEINQDGMLADYKIGYSDAKMPYFASAVTEEIKRFKGKVKAAAGAYTMLIRFRYEGEDYEGDKSINYKLYDGNIIITAGSSTSMSISHR